MRYQTPIIVFLFIVICSAISAQNFRFEKLRSPVSQYLVDWNTEYLTLEWNPLYQTNSTFSLDRTANEALDLPLLSYSYNLNLSKVDPCRSPGSGDINLSLIRDGYDPYYVGSNYTTSFPKNVACTLVRSFLRGLR